MIEKRLWRDGTCISLQPFLYLAEAKSAIEYGGFAECGIQTIFCMGVRIVTKPLIKTKQIM